MPDVLLKGNAEPALLLLQNLSCEKLCRHSIIKSGGVELLLQLLAGSSLVLKQQHPKLVSYLTGTLLNLVTGDGEGSPAKQLFAKAGGMEAGCKVCRVVEVGDDLDSLRGRSVEKTATQHPARDDHTSSLSHSLTLSQHRCWRTGAATTPPPPPCA